MIRRAFCSPGTAGSPFWDIPAFWAPRGRFWDLGDIFRCFWKHFGSSFQWSYQLPFWGIQGPCRAVPLHLGIARHAGGLKWNIGAIWGYLGQPCTNFAAFMAQEPGSSPPAWGDLIQHTGGILHMLWVLHAHTYPFTAPLSHFASASLLYLSQGLSLLNHPFAICRSIAEGMMVGHIQTPTDETTVDQTLYSCLHMCVKYPGKINQYQENQMCY